MGRTKNIENNTTDKVYEAIVRLTKQKGVAPSVRELGQDLGFSSTCSVAYHINELIKQGRIARDDKKSRSITIVGANAHEVMPTPKEDFVNIPLVGTITAGTPILAVENYDDVFSIPKSLFHGDDLFMLRVSGTSMIEAGINDGDYIIVKKQPTANNGDIVAALLDDHATVKRFFKESNRFRLQPENILLKPIYTDHVDILGVVIGLIRRY